MLLKVILNNNCFYHMSFECVKLKFINVYKAKSKNYTYFSFVTESIENIFSDIYISCSININDNIINIIQEYLCSWVMVDYIDDGVEELCGCGQRTMMMENKPKNYMNEAAVSSDITKIIIKCTGYDYIYLSKTTERREIIKISKCIIDKNDDRDNITIKKICGIIGELCNELDLSCSRLEYNYKIRNKTVHIDIREY